MTFFHPHTHTHICAEKMLYALCPYKNYSFVSHHVNHFIDLNIYRLALESNFFSFNTTIVFDFAFLFFVIFYFGVLSVINCSIEIIQVLFISMVGIYDIFSSAHTHTHLR